MKRVLTIVVVSAVAVALAVTLVINGVRSARANDLLRQCEVHHPIGTDAYDRCAADARSAG